jgi:hypothetical protein
MPKEITPAQSVSDTPATPKTLTKWNALAEARLAPTEIVCMGYRPYHLFDASCHTRLMLNPAQIKAHIEGGHGGGFKLHFRKADKPWPGWKQFEELGLESMDFRCDICDAQVPFHPTHILKHMRPHNGKTRRVLPGGDYLMTLNVGLPSLSEEDAFADFE